MADLLEFEEPIAILLKEIEALSMLPRTEDRNREIARLEKRIDSIRLELYKNLTAWQRVLVARHPARNEVKHAFADHTKAKRVFGLGGETSLDEGVARMCACFSTGASADWTSI